MIRHRFFNAFQLFPRNEEIIHVLNDSSDFAFQVILGSKLLQVIFGCEELEFYRTKKRGEKLVQIEFNQSVGATEDGKIHVDC